VAGSNCSKGKWGGTLWGSRPISIAGGGHRECKEETLKGERLTSCTGSTIRKSYEKGKDASEKTIIRELKSARKRKKKRTLDGGRTRRIPYRNGPIILSFHKGEVKVLTSRTRRAKLHLMRGKRLAKGKGKPS